MARYTWIAVAMFAAAGAGGQVVEPRVAEVQVGAADGPALVKLARGAMAEYLANRTPVEKQDIPERLAHLEREQRTYAASVTLRLEGRPVGRAVKSVSIKNDRGISGPAGVCRNVIAAALEAMRSEQLPDKITPVYLDSLTVEVEILSPPAAVEAPPGRKVAGPDVDRMILPGRTGLRVLRGSDMAYLLPSDGYVKELDATGIRQAAVASVPQRPANAGMDWRFWLLESRHFVEYGDAARDLAGQTLCLTRGKTRRPDMMVSKEAAAEEIGRTLPRVAAYLAANQTGEGVYAVHPIPEESDASEPAVTPLRDHLAAVCAMLRAGQRLRDETVFVSGMKGLEYAVSLCRRESGRAYVETDPLDQYGATAMLAYAMSLAPRNPQSEALNGELIRALLEGIGKDGWPSARLDGEPSKARPELRDALLAYMVLFGAAGTEKEVAAYGAMEKALTVARPSGAADALWRLRVGLGPMTPSPQSPDWLAAVSQVLPGQGRDDELGGFAFGRHPAEVELTALALTVRSGGQGWTSEPIPSDPDKRALQWSTMTTLAQAFVCTMMYHANEAYFSKDPSVWLGAVRVDAGTARVTPAACAAAMEILLMETTTVTRDQ